jgi:LacI family transcriptional regulator
MSQKKVNLREIAKEANVSVSAVSLALRNSSKVSEKVRHHIQNLAQQMGYRKDPRIVELMEHLRQNRDDQRESKIAVLIPEISKAEIPEYHPIRDILAGIQSAGKNVGFGAEFFSLADLKANAKRLRTILFSREIHGLILAPYRSGVGTMDLDSSDLRVQYRESIARSCVSELSSDDG